MHFDSNLLNGIIFLFCVVFLYFFVRSAKRKPANSPDTLPTPDAVAEPEFDIESVLEMARQIYGRGYRYNDEIQKALNYPQLLSKEEHLGILKVADRICEYAGGLLGDKAFDKNGNPYLKECENFRKTITLKVTKAALKKSTQNL